MNAETVRTNIKMPPWFERRWVACAKPEMCPAMASVVPETIKRRIHMANKDQMFADQTWIENALSHFEGPPGMELRTLSPDEFESSADYYAILFRVPLPNSNDPQKLFPVARLGYAQSALSRDKSALRREVMELFRALVIHETKEWLKFDGKYVEDPHPENN